MEKNICIITYQFSVVVKGLEKELINLGYEVSMVGDNLEDIQAFTTVSDLFLLYMADDVTDHADVVRNLLRICDTITDAGKRLIVIGAEKARDSLYREVPPMIDYPWVERPVEMRVLKQEINRELQRIEEINRRMKILIVDDDPTYAAMVKQWLIADYDVDVVNDGMATIAHLMKNKVDLVLLDYEMPVVDGSQVLEMLQSHPQTSKIPVVFLTGVKSKKSVEKVVKLHPEGYILKSITRDQLVATLEEFFRSGVINTLIY